MGSLGGLPLLGAALCVPQQAEVTHRLPGGTNILDGGCSQGSLLLAAQTPQWVLCREVRCLS